ncbi:menaquinone-dependent protoporphyrinogen IX dehydrogenase [Propionivibrio limicola]|uniref:menaquinone-dependent protoporphyrinogen IX dehydrogenase n=1 Tax=Propionivibrio limicola TaxID=167645 RepID=UPI0012908BAC|nr:menaquinone-dependent protoporphyrinogen IX dehydrogenase [Propionivibrio limicola]
MANILILYSTVDGHTLKICQRLKQVIDQTGNVTTLASIDDGQRIDPASFDKIVIGASIRYGKHRPNVADFINAHQPLLESRPSAFFTVNIVARKPEKNRPETNPYLRKFLRQISWKPQQLEVFAGKLDYPRYGFFDRQMIRFIMYLTKGPTDPSTVVEFTDWPRVEAFGRTLSSM